jgi:hypothetical protein
MFGVGIAIGDRTKDSIFMGTDIGAGEQRWPCARTGTDCVLLRAHFHAS